MMFFVLIAWDGEGANIDSSDGMPLWAYLIAVAIIFYVVIKVRIALRRDKNGRNKRN
jgi:hypothetical protein